MHLTWRLSGIGWLVGGDGGDGGDVRLRDGVQGRACSTLVGFR